MCIILTKTIQFLISIISLNLPFCTTHFRTPLSNLFFACFRFPSLPKWLSRQLWSLSANSSLPFALELPSFRILSCSRSSPYFLQFCCPANRLILAFPFMLMAVNEMIPSGQHTKRQQQNSWICFPSCNQMYHRHHILCNHSDLQSCGIRVYCLSHLKVVQDFSIA